MSKPQDPKAYRSFDELMERLQSIVKAVRSKNATLEESLDLLEEGVALGLQATDLVEKPSFSEREQKELETRTASAARPLENAQEVTPSSVFKTAESI